jgi:hypothetical protein
MMISLIFLKIMHQHFHPLNVSTKNASSEVKTFRYEVSKLFCFLLTGVWTQGLMLARQCSTTPPALFWLSVFEVGSHELLPWADFRTVILLISASWIARVIGVSHQCLAPNYFQEMFCLSQYMYTWKCLKETPCVAILVRKTKMSFFTFTKLENRSCLGEGLVPVGEGRKWGRSVGGWI